MNISFFLIAVISSVAIAKPLLDFQTNTPFGYFPSSFGAADATDSWGSPVMQAPGNDNTFPDSSNPAQMNLASSNVPDNSDPSPISNGPDNSNLSPISNGPDNSNPSPISNGPDNSNPTPISNGPAEKDPTSNHATTDHPPGTSPAFRQFREFWCGTHEGRDQSICCMGNKYGTFRPFSGELTCEKKQWVLGAGTETIGILDPRFLRYCHQPAYYYSCTDYYSLYKDFQCYSDCDLELTPSSSRKML